MERISQRRALSLRLQIAGIVAIAISFVFFHPIESLILPLARLTLGSAWYDLQHRHVWGLLGDSFIILTVLATIVTIHYGRAFWRDNCRSMARSMRVVWCWKLRPTTQRFAVAALVSTFLFVATPQVLTWTYGHQIREMGPLTPSAVSAGLMRD